VALKFNSSITIYRDSLKILNVGYRSINCYLLITEKTKLLVDVGWPGGMQELKWNIAAQGFSVS
jgi:hypothetical protein